MKVKVILKDTSTSLCVYGDLAIPGRHIIDGFCLNNRTWTSCANTYQSEHRSQLNNALYFDNKRRKL